MRTWFPVSRSVTTFWYISVHVIQVQRECALQEKSLALTNVLYVDPRADTIAYGNKHHEMRAVE